MTVPIDPIEFRQALGRFTTGICVATTLDPEGTPVGLTINSFNSVSLDPPLVLWSIGKSTASRPDFETSDHFSINVLSSDQKPVSDRFARPGDKFSEVDWREGSTGAPVLDGCIATFECRTAHRYEGGDHIIVIGEVVRFERREGQPLLYVDGTYGVAHPLREAV